MEMTLPRSATNNSYCSRKERGTWATRRAPRFSLLAILLLAGCATTERVWVKPGASDQDFFMDQGFCKAQAFGAPGMYTMQVAMIFASCMNGRGWYMEERRVER
jgi:hypothetical protein